MPTIEISYAKKLGLRNFSSHSFSVSVKTEVPTIEDVEKVANQQYVLLQDIVDKNLQEEGFVPEGDDNRSSQEPSHANGNGSRNYRSNGNGGSSNRGDYWKCSDRQRDLIEKVIKDNRLDWQEIENLAKDMFNAPVKTLNKMEASGLIEELLHKYAPTKSNSGNGNGNGRRQYQRGGAR